MTRNTVTVDGEDVYEVDHNLDEHSQHAAIHSNDGVFLFEAPESYLDIDLECKEPEEDTGTRRQRTVTLRINSDVEFYLELVDMDIVVGGDCPITIDEKYDCEIWLYGDEV